MRVVVAQACAGGASHAARWPPARHTAPICVNLPLMVLAYMIAGMEYPFIMLYHEIEHLTLTHDTHLSPQCTPSTVMHIRPHLS